MFCRRCGLEMPDTAASCGRCGEPLTVGRAPVHARHGRLRPSDVSPRSRLVLLLLCVFFGVAGIHRFYAGRILTGLLWLCTFGLLWVGWVFDLVLIACGAFRDGQGRRITNWE